MTRMIDPPHYFWLWHLAALKVIDADFGPAPGAVPPQDVSALRGQAAPNIAATLWDSIPQAGEVVATVALIDTGVSRAHPNLASRIDAGRSIDLTSHRYGAQTRAAQPQDGPYDREEKAAFFQNLSLGGLGPMALAPDELDYLEAMVAEYRGAHGVVRQMLDAEETFAAHGTACAGSILGEPAAVDGAINLNANLLPYFGVDPFSKLISIRTSFEADPYQFIAAFLYAWACKVDVIVLPRGQPDPVRAPLQPKNDLKAELEMWRGRRICSRDWGWQAMTRPIRSGRKRASARPALEDLERADAGYLKENPDCLRGRQ